MKLLKPSKLEAGDTVEVVAPCPPVLPSFRENYERGKHTLEAMGFKLKEGKAIGLQDGYSAGTPQQQAADINAMFATLK
jgi:muramoyltetrapeptide carboxypeptidase